MRLIAVASVSEALKSFCGGGEEFITLSQARYLNLPAVTREDLFTLADTPVKSALTVAVALIILKK